MKIPAGFACVINDKGNNIISKQNFWAIKCSLCSGYFGIYFISREFSSPEIKIRFSVCDDFVDKRANCRRDSDPFSRKLTSNSGKTTAH